MTLQRLDFVIQTCIYNPCMYCMVVKYISSIVVTLFNNKTDFKK